MAWRGLALGICGLALRPCALLTLRDRYTRTFLVQHEHSFERGGPYQWVRHPGYLGSLLCLNATALASGNSVTLLPSLVATWGAYAYRIRVAEAMLVAAFGLGFSRFAGCCPVPRKHRRGWRQSFVTELSSSDG